MASEKILESKKAKVAALTEKLQNSVSFVLVDYKGITLIVDGVWPDYNSDCAFTNRLLVQPQKDGSFRYLSNSIEEKELEIPVSD